MEKELIYILTTNKIDEELINNISKKLNIPINLINNEIYEILSTFLNGGMFIEENKPIEWFDKKELKIGEQIEKEHLSKTSKYTSTLARRIALDHLTEIKDYYTRLVKMEEESKK